MALSPDLDSLLARVGALRDEIDAMRPLTDEQAGRAMQRLRIEWTYHSNAIEGNSLTYGETRALLLHDRPSLKGKPYRDHESMKRHREVIDVVESLAETDEPLTLAVLREMHRMLMGDTYEITAETLSGERVKRTVEGGVFKDLPNNVVTETGETHYYASPEETPALMADLVHSLREGSDKHPVVQVALFHHAFVEIHPFPDGNGRMVRLLMNLLLMRARYVPAVIRQEQRPAYYGALAAADGGDRQPIIEFVAGELAGTMELYLRALRGEPDPTVFDRRLALLRRETEGLPSREMDRERRAYLATEFVLPLLDRVKRDVDGLGSLFGEIKDRLTVVRYEEGKSEEEIAPLLLAGGDWESFKCVFSLDRLNVEPAVSVGVVIEGTVGVSGFRLKARPGIDGESFRGSDLPGFEEVEGVAVMISEALMDQVEGFVRKYR